MTAHEKRTSRSVWLRTARFFLVVAAALGLVTASFMACTASKGNTFNDDDDGEAGSGNNSGVGGFGFGGNLLGGQGPGPAVAYLEGTVLAPEGTIPISGALVYVTHEMPDPIPSAVYCDRCAELPPTTPYPLSSPDGSFPLGVPSLGEWLLVVQKGPFRRIRTVNVPTEETHPVETAFTTLPSVSNPAENDSIPRIAVSYGIWDDIQDSLAKLGLGQVDGSGNLVPGSQSFDIYDGSSAYPGGGSVGQGSQLLSSYDSLAQYHIVFFPCTDSWPDSYLMQQPVKDGITQYVRDGGRLYVTDYSYDIVRQVFPDPIHWIGDFGGFGDAESGVYDAPATVNDADMAQWMAAQGITTWWLEDNWTKVDAVTPYTAPDENGTVTTLDPIAWVSGDLTSEGYPGLHPATISFQYGCGRAMFSTYHTEAWGEQGLMAQERALLYIILEMAVCLGDFPPPR